MVSAEEKEEEASKGLPSLNYYKFISAEILGYE
jgi:hypothetical protein